MVFPLLKDSYTGKFMELEFSQNLSLRPKDEVQSTYFCGKQFTLHCAIVEPADYRYHYHITGDTKHDPIFVDQVIRDIITHYNIRNEDLWIQSDNAPTQYKNKHAFRLYQNLADEFGLRVIRPYGAAGHNKGVIDALSSFGAKNILGMTSLPGMYFLTTAKQSWTTLQRRNLSSVTPMFQLWKWSPSS